jgi:hypothetical protein
MSPLETPGGDNRDTKALGNFLLILIFLCNFLNFRFKVVIFLILGVFNIF